MTEKKEPKTVEKWAYHPQVIHELCELLRDIKTPPGDRTCGHVADLIVTLAQSKESVQVKERQ